MAVRDVCMSVNNASYLELPFSLVLSWLPQVAKSFRFHYLIRGCVVSSGSRGPDDAWIPATFGLGILNGWDSPEVILP